MNTYLNTRILGAIVDPAACAECRGRRDGVQIYSSIRLRDGVRLAWDVELALQICADGREAVEFTRARITEMLRVNQVDPVHLEHVDPRIPGIACVLEYTAEGQAAICLIDGSHRAARCLRDHIPFYIYLLTDEESMRCQQTELVRMFLSMREYEAKRKRGVQADALFDPKCAECQEKRHSPQVFTFERRDGQVFAWSIDLAIRICSDGRTPFPVPLEDLETILGVNQVADDHLDHVDSDIPGIACVCGNMGGQPLLVLIDGSHRAARCRRDRRAFLVYLLSTEESQRCQEHVPQMLSDFAKRFTSL